MPFFVQRATDILSALTVAADVLAVLLLAALLARAFAAAHPWLEPLRKFCGRRALFFSFLVALAGLLASLFYSDIAGFAPCLLCWWQRVFLYPQVAIFAAALLARDAGVWRYGVTLSGLGGAIALYHTYIQFGGSPLLPCAASGISASCAERYFLEYGYVTIPTMSLTSFALIILFFLAALPRKEGDNR